MFKHISMLFTLAFLITISSQICHAHGGRLAADGWHNDNVNGGRHCHGKVNVSPVEPEDTPEPTIPKLDTLSYLCHKVEVVDVYDGDTITIDINDRHVRVRLAGIDTPELNAKTEEEKNEAIQSRDYLESLILDQEIIVLFEKSDTTLDGINRGNFGRPIAYIFILEDRLLPDVKTFVNQDMIAKGYAVKSEYDVDYPVLFTEGFDFSNISVNAHVNANIGKADVNTRGKATTTWAELKM